MKKIYSNIFTLCSLLLLLIPQLTRAETKAPPSQDSPVTVELVSDVDSVQAGIPFRLGVRFNIPEPWHIYWKNPGDSGLPTKISFNGPEGSYFHQVSWPLPIRFTQPGNIIGYGYEHEALFMTEVTPPATITAKTFEVTATIKWLNCAQFCVPGKAERKLSLPMSSANSELSNKNNNVRLFTTARYPVEQQELESLVKISVDKSSANEVVLLLKWHNKALPFEVFPYAAEAEVKTAVVTQKEKTSTVVIPVSLKGNEATVEALVTLKDSQDRAVGTTIFIPTKKN